MPKDVTGRQQLGLLTTHQQPASSMSPSIATDNMCRRCQSPIVASANGFGSVSPITAIVRKFRETHHFSPQGFWTWILFPAKMYSLSNTSVRDMAMSVSPIIGDL